MPLFFGCRGFVNYLFLYARLSRYFLGYFFFNRFVCVCVSLKMVSFGRFFYIKYSNLLVYA